MSSTPFPRGQPANETDDAHVSGNTETTSHIGTIRQVDEAGNINAITRAARDDDSPTGGDKTLRLGQPTQTSTVEDHVRGRAHRKTLKQPQHSTSPASSDLKSEPSHNVDTNAHPTQPRSETPDQSSLRCRNIHEVWTNSADETEEINQ
jgi:hypothetical protein